MSHFQPLQPEGIYHIFNHANGSEKLFRNEENYRYFLKKMEEHLLPVFDIYTYSLLPNHFHIVVRAGVEARITVEFERKKGRRPENEGELSRFLMERVSNWLNSYAKAYNKYYNRMGSLFMSTKRSVVKIESDFTNFIVYVHRNAVHHGLAQQIGTWEFDAYPIILSSEPTYLLRDELFEWFGSREVFVKVHEQQKP